LADVNHFNVEGGHMSFQEKSTWIVTAMMLLVYGWYFAVVLGRTDAADVSGLHYQGVMLVTLVVFVVLVAGAHIVVALSSPREAERSDDRDREINRHGEYVGGYVLGTGAVLALVLAVVESPHFWIANVILLGLVLSEVVTGVTKIVLYRRGI
jgi:uncharacterized membrane protein YidH (DUF202 family)